MRSSRTFFYLLVVAGLLLSCTTDGPGTSSGESKPLDEMAAVTALQDINRAQADFIRRTRRYAQRTEELIAERLMPGEPVAEGYSILMLPSPDAGSYTVKATPRAPEARHFFTDQSGVIRAETGKAATVDSPAFPS